MATVQLALRRFQTDFGVQWHLLMAASFLAVLPVFVVFLVLQKRIVAGISMTGLKY
jgi:multiple sugar transport system permease protein